jgi:Spy/CpxP family protein refolding chaperone
MKKRNITAIVLSAIFMIFSTCAVNAQVDSSDNVPPQTENEPLVRRDLLGELGLTKEQIQQIRKLNAQRKPLMQDAQQRLREANRNLDQAIYADALDEVTIQIRLKEVQLAHAEVFKIRAMNELEVRKILTPEQLVKFRDLRERFMNRVKNKQQNRRQNLPNRNLNNKDSNSPTRRQNNRQRP